jgi:DNA-binding NarL/FixJ family response regulator
MGDQARLEDGNNPEDCLVLLVDHQPLYLEALSSVVGAIQRLRVVTHALGSLEGLQNVDPDVIVIDPCTGGAFSTDHLKTAKRLWPLSRVMVLTDCNEPDVVVSALAYGAHSFLLKSESIDTIRAAVELLCGGAAAFSLPVAVVMAAKVTPPLVAPSLPAPAARGLSPREVEILQLVARGLTDAEIGRLSAISPRTVQRHITNILNKLNCRNRSHAVAQVIGAAPPLSLVRPRSHTMEDLEVGEGVS